VSIERTGAHLKLRVHIGVVAFGPHGGTAEEHLNRARSLAEQVDAAGGYKLDLAECGGTSSRREQGIDWETHLDHALSNESIIPYAQRVTALQSAEHLAPLYRIVPRFLRAEEVIAIPLEYEAPRLALRFASWSTCCYEKAFSGWGPIATMPRRRARMSLDCQAIH